MTLPITGCQLISVLIVEDDPDMRFLIVATLQLDGRCEVIAESWSGQYAFDVWNDNLPDVVLLDLRLPEQSGLEIARSILAAAPRQKIILFSAYHDPGDVEDALRIGVTSCLRKTEIADLPDAIVAAAGQRGIYTLPGQRTSPATRGVL